MLGLAFGLLRMAIRMSLGLMDLCIYACTLGKFDPRTRSFL